MYTKLILLTIILTVVFLSVVTALETGNGTNSNEEAQTSYSDQQKHGRDLMERGRRKKLFYGLGGLCMIISCHYS